MFTREELRRHFGTVLASHPKLALVLPAFELLPSLGRTAQNVSLVPSDKSLLLRLWDPH
jgi:hypothetical protein